MSEENILPVDLEVEEPEVAPVAEVEEAPVVTEEAPVIETKVEEVAADLGIVASAPIAADETTDNIVSSPKASKKSAPKKPALAPVADGVLGSSAVPDKVVKTAVEEEVEKVAIYSPKNLSWVGVGKLRSGYNIVSAKFAEAWLTRKGVRLATPEEVAKEYNK